jgi:Polyketide cyclase / dehydrase and lipid transport
VTPRGAAEASETIAAGADRLYDLISDITRMGDWSPEACRGRWRGSATGPAVGARFRGSNRSGWRRWSTDCEVTAAERGKRFAFRVSSIGMPVALWSYDFEPAGSGTRVVERWSDLRSSFLTVVSRPVTGVSDRVSHNQRTMEQTLAGLKAAVEKDAT